MKIIYLKHPLKNSTRWFKQLDNGEYHRICVKPGEQPPEGYQRGFPQFLYSPEEQERRREHARHLGSKAKSDETKHKMSLAKKDKPKTDEHRRNMSEAQLRRCRRLAELEEQYNLRKEDAKIVYAYERKAKREYTFEEIYRLLETTYAD